MRIGFIVDYFWPHIGGMETWTIEVSRELVRQGHEVVVYTYKTYGHTVEETINGVEIRRFGPSALSRLFRHTAPYPYVPRLLALSFWLPRKLLEDPQINLLLVTYAPLIFIGPIAKLFHSETWGIFHGFYGATEAIGSKGYFRGLIGTFAEMLAMRMPVQGFIAVGNQVKKELVARGVNRIKIDVIRGGVNLREIDSVQVQKSRRPQVCFVSRLIPERRLDHLMQAFRSVLRNIPDAKLIVIGEGPLRQDWEGLARTLNLDRNIRFEGALYGEAKVRVLKESHILVHPTTQEGMSLIIYESLASRTPVIAYDISEVKEQLGITKGGILVRQGDIEGLAQAMLKLLQNSKLREELAAEGRTSIEQGLTWETVAKDLLRVTRLTPS